MANLPAGYKTLFISLKHSTLREKRKSRLLRKDVNWGLAIKRRRYVISALLIVWIAFFQVAEVEDQQRNRQNKSLILDGFIQEIETRPPVIEEFDRKLWSVTVDKRLRFTKMGPAIDGKEGQPYHE